jgi:hypothetical protein
VSLNNQPGAKRKNRRGKLFEMKTFPSFLASAIQFLSLPLFSGKFGLGNDHRHEKERNFSGI